MKLSILTNMFAPYRAPLFRRLAASGEVGTLRVLVCAEREPDRRWRVEPDAGYVTHKLPGISLRLRRGSDGLRILHLRPGIVWELLRHRPDRLIIGDASLTSHLAAGMCLLLGIPYVLWNEIGGQAKPRGGAMAWLRRFSCRHALAGIAAGGQSRDFLAEHGLPRQRTVIARNAVDNDFFLGLRARWEPLRRRLRSELGIADDAFALLFVGQFVSRKRVLETLRAAATADRSRPLHLIMAGAGPLEAELKRLAAELDFHRVVFCGHVEPDRLGQLYVASDALILLSEDEPWGMVINEALLFGKPVLAAPTVVAALELRGIAGDGAITLIDPRGDFSLETGFLERVAARMPDIRVPPGIGEMAASIMACLAPSHAGQA